MSVLAHQRCFNHAQREAAVRCPGCRRFFCRECVTEHEHRLLCAACLRAQVQEEQARSRLRRPLRALAQLAAALVLLWAVFFIIGSALLQLPAAFHAAPPAQKAADQGNAPGSQTLGAPQ